MNNNNKIIYVDTINSPLGRDNKINTTPPKPIKVISPWSN